MSPGRKPNFSPASTAGRERIRRWTLPQIILSAIIILLSLSCLLPFVNVLAISLSSKSAILRGDVAFLPVETELTAYKAIFADKNMIRSMFFTIGITVGYTALSMLMTVLMAYPLTKQRLKGRRIFSFLALFTMYFSGGTIPIYLIVVCSMWDLVP